MTHCNMKLLSGNEAIARGAYEAGVKVACGYPGTPGTEILENIAKYAEIYSEWAPNEKVAVEVAQGASIAGARSLAAMKHVGVNVAADPLFSLAYTGVNAGFVLISADDPGMHSSQNEQDNRYYAKFMKMPLLEPSDSQEAKDFVLAGLDISEQFDVPVLLRITTRIAHAKTVVAIGEKQERPNRAYKKDFSKYVVMPANARKLRVSLEERLQRLSRFADSFAGNRIEGHGRQFAVIASGIAYQYVREVLGDQVTCLKLSFTYPLPEQMIRRFVAEHDTVYVIEEGEPFLEERIKALGLPVIGKELFPSVGELSPAVLRDILLGTKLAAGSRSFVAAPLRPPVLCPGCPHRGVFFAISHMADIVPTDIGCYTLGALPPLQTGDTCICMGASIGNAMGLSKVLPDKKIVAAIGDSTFLHSGITGLMNVVYNRTVITVVIMDNSITGMTGHQHNPATGFTIKNEATAKVDLEAMVRACGIEKVWIVNAANLAEVETALAQATACGEPAVIITRRPCVLIEKGVRREACSVNANCRSCKACLRLGCPAIQNKDDHIGIDATLCTGCGLCGQVCKFSAIGKAVEP